MVRERDEVVDRFEAAGEDGAIYTVFVYQRIVESRFFPRGEKQTAGSKQLVLPDGSPVTRIDDKTFKVVSTGSSRSFDAFPVRGSSQLARSLRQAHAAGRRDPWPISQSRPARIIAS